MTGKILLVLPLRGTQREVCGKRDGGGGRKVQSDFLKPIFFGGEDGSTLVVHKS